jgi:hypothetical protein
MKRYTGWLIVCFLTLACGLYAGGKTVVPVVGLRKSSDAIEVERLIASALKLPVQRRIEFVSKYLIGRRYHPDTKKRIKKQRKKPVKKVEASNGKPLSVKILPTSMTYLDCMTYVEHVLALAASTKPEYQEEFLCRLIDVMYNANGQPLMNHHRNHFTSQWGDVNEQKGYLINVARDHPLAQKRELYLNRVGNNRTFYVEDRFTIAEKPQLMWYFPRTVVLDKKAPLFSGDVVALVTDKEGLDVTHMGFFIEKKGKHWLRHASYKLNRIIDQDLEKYLLDNKHVGGLMIFRPLLQSQAPYRYSFKLVDSSAKKRRK